MKIKGTQNVCLDGYLDFMIQSYVKFNVDLLNKPLLIYQALTLYELNFIPLELIKIVLEIFGSADRITVVG